MQRHGMLYAACYEKEFDALTAEGEVLNTLRTHAQKKGLVYRIPLDTGVPELFADRLSQVAGCNVCHGDNALWVSELTNLVRIPLHPGDDLPTREWRRVAPFNPTLLAHNICVDELGQRIMFAYFRRVNAATSIVLQHSGIAFFVLSLCSYAYHYVIGMIHPLLLLNRLRPLLFGTRAPARSSQLM